MYRNSYFVPNDQGGSWRCAILRDLGLDGSDYGDKIKPKLASLTPSELVALGEKYMPGLDGRGALTFLIRELFNRVLATEKA